jgi:hypothetical protein
MDHFLFDWDLPASTSREELYGRVLKTAGESASVDNYVSNSTPFCCGCKS